MCDVDVYRHTVCMVLFYACYIVYMYIIVHIIIYHLYIIYIYIIHAPYCEHFEWIHCITWRVPSPIRPTLPGHLWGELWSRRQLVVNRYKNDLTWNFPLIPWVYECLLPLHSLSHSWSTLESHYILIPVEIPHLHLTKSLFFYCQAIAYRVAAADVNVRCSYVDGKLHSQGEYQ